MIKIFFGFFKNNIFKHFNIKFIFVILLIIKFDSSFASCFNFIPYAHNELYTHLPPSSKFCVKIKDGKINYNITKNFSRNLSYNSDEINEIYAFGDSQFLGIDWDKSSLKKHDLETINKNNKISIFAAPNNGPFQVINLVNSMSKKIFNNKYLKKLIFSFNYGNDIFRLQKKWKLKNFVPLKSKELPNIISKPFLYDLVLLRGLLTGKYFSVNLPDNKKTLDLFKKLNEKELILRSKLWLNKIKNIKNTFKKPIEIVFFPAYWTKGLSKQDIIFVNTKFQSLICQFESESVFDNIFVGITNPQKTEYTEDKRHFANGYLVYKKFKDSCK